MTITVDILKKIVKEEAWVLPDQAPLEHFVHHNNLHHFEAAPFEQSIESVFLNYGKTPYMPLNYYRSKLQTQEIKDSFFEDALERNGFSIQDESLLHFIKSYLHQHEDPEELSFFKREGLMFSLDSSEVIKMDERAHALWSEVNQCIIPHKVKTFPDFHVNRSLDRMNKVLIPLFSSLMDQGQAGCQLSDHERSLPLQMFEQYLKPLLTKKELKKLKRLEALDDNLEQILIQHFLGEVETEDELRKIVRYHLHSLPGWAGMIYKTSQNKEVIPRKEVHLTIYHFLFFRLFLQELLNKKSAASQIPITTEAQIKENVFSFLFYNNNTKETPQNLINLFCMLDPLILQRIFQQSYEESYQSLILTGLQAHKNQTSQSQIKYQMFFCIDDREESFRRYLEETSEKVETFGVAGFFGLDMMFQKINEPRARRFCPPAANPQYLIKEEGDAPRFSIASWFHDTHTNFLKSTLYNFFISPFKSLEMKFHLFFPREKRAWSKILRRSEVKKIHCYNQDGEKEGHFKLGYTLEEAAARIAAILKGAGLVDNFSNYLIMIGHGHDSYNNPHVAAYRCGACSGANASPNAKIFAQMANDPRVRELLKNQHQMIIPDSTHFIGGYHDTCNDRIDLFDLSDELITPEDLKELREVISQSQMKNAQERCLKFYQTPEPSSTHQALKFVEQRAWHVAEPRPELNHATNALCIVGRRQTLTKNVFLDRKAFLVSYDPCLDDEEGTILAGLLKAVIPVCAGINLEYYFSKVDTENYGSGSKTSHNVSGFLGVMNGIRGDLRTGLVWQMVEYHDPLRILFVIETTSEKLNIIMRNNEEVRNLIQNSWISLAIVHPDQKDDFKVYRDGHFVPFKPLDLSFKTFHSSSEVPTGLTHPVHLAFIEGNS